MGGRKTVADRAGTARVLIDGNEKLRNMAQALTKSSVHGKTHNAYAASVAKIGGYTVDCFLQKMLREYEKPVRPVGLKKYSPRYREATATVRHLKAACLHMARYHREPWADDDSREIENLLVGFEAENVPPRRRAALTVAQFQDFVAEARRQGLQDVANAALLQWVTCTRPRDVRAVCLARVRREERGHYSMWAERKIPIHLKVRYGFDEIRPIMGEEAQEIVASRVRVYQEMGVPSHLPFFPSYTCANVRKVLAEVAKTWPEDLLYDGAHNFRHGSAAEAFASAIADVREHGAWRSNASARHYGTQGLAGRAEAAAAREQQTRQGLLAL